MIDNISSRPKHRTRILSKLKVGKPVFRQDLADETALSPATVFRITKQLLHESILKETPSRLSVGRPSLGLELNENFASVLGISLTMSRVTALKLNLKGKVLLELERPLDISAGAAGILKTLAEVVAEIKAQAGNFSVAGMAIPGQWDPERGISISYPRVTDWKDVPILRLLEEWSGSGAAILRYNPALALGEQFHGSDAGLKHILSVEVEENIAMGVVANGELVDGASGNAGELGHITLDPQGKACYCGNTGCLETVATCQSVVEEARQSDIGLVTYEKIVDHARNGHAFAVRLLGRVATTLGVGLAAAVNLLNPEAVILNGKFFDAGELVMKPLRYSMENRMVSAASRKIRIERSNLGKKAAAFGAGMFAIQKLVRTL